MFTLTRFTHRLLYKPTTFKLARQSSIWSSLQDKSSASLIKALLPPEKHLKDLVKAKKLACEPSVVETVYKVANQALQHSNLASTKQEAIEALKDVDNQILTLVNGHIPSITRLAVMAALYQDENGNRPGVPISLRLFDVATQESMDAEYEFAKLMYAGIFSEEPELKGVDAKAAALMKMRELAAQGHLLSEYSLATHLARSENVDELKQGIEMLQELSEKNIPSVWMHLASLHDMTGYEGELLKKAGFHADRMERRKCLEKCISAPDPNHQHRQAMSQAYYLLGVLYANGEAAAGVKKDMAKAHELYEKSASLGGLAIAQHNLGALYLLGVPDSKPNTWIIPKSEAMARQYFEMAASQRFQPSLVNLGKMSLEAGDREKAKEYFQKAVDVGGPFGPAEMEIMLQNG